MDISIAILAYLGPETVLPVTSVIAGVAGVIMLLGKASIRRGMQLGRGLMALLQTRTRPRKGPSRKIGTGPMSQIDRPESSRTKV